jgi:hypothetical protein
MHLDLWVTYHFPVHPGREMSMHCFQPEVGPVRFVEKARRDTLRQASVLHPVGSVGHVMHSSASKVCNVD